MELKLWQLIGAFLFASAAVAQPILLRPARVFDANSTEVHEGWVVLVSGELGAGKTTLVRGACRELGVAVPVTSPTFTIGQLYPANVPVSHIDLFRIDRMTEEEPDLLADYLGPDKIAFIEWPPAGPSEHAELGRIACRIHIEHAGGDRRVVEIA